MADELNAPNSPTKTEAPNKASEHTVPREDPLPSVPATGVEAEPMATAGEAADALPPPPPPPPAPVDSEISPPQANLSSSTSESRSSDSLGTPKQQASAAKRESDAAEVNTPSPSSATPNGPKDDDVARSLSPSLERDPRVPTDAPRLVDLTYTRPLKAVYPFSPQYDAIRERAQNGSPYIGLVYWVKLHGHSYWPGRLATMEERLAIAQRDHRKFPSVESVEGASPTELCPIFFFGSHELALVRKQFIEPYLDKFSELSTKCNNIRFYAAMEEADGEVLRSQYPNGTGRCMKCGGTHKPSSILLCDQCNGEIHLACVEPKLNRVPNGVFLCPVCTVESPFTKEINTSKPKKSNKVSREKPAPESAAEVEEEGGATPLASPNKQRSGEGEDDETSDDDEESDEGGNDSKKRTIQFWTQEEDDLLWDLIQTHSEKRGIMWTKIAVSMPTRTESGLRNRWQYLRKRLLSAGEAASVRSLPGVRGWYVGKGKDENEAMELVEGTSVLAPTEDAAPTGAAVTEVSDPPVVAATSEEEVVAAVETVAVSPAPAEAESKKAPSVTNIESEAPPPKRMKISEMIAGGTAAGKTKETQGSGSRAAAAAAAAAAYSPHAPYFIPPPPTATFQLPAAIQPHREMVSSQLENLLKRMAERAVETAAQAMDCFACTRSGATLTCALCPKTYHPFCVARSAESTKRFVCPWHECSVCKLSEEEVLLNQELNDDGEQQQKYARPDFEASVTHWELIASCRTFASDATAGPRYSSRQRDKAVGGGAETTEMNGSAIEPPRPSEKVLGRCYLCPLALCEAHREVPVLLESSTGEARALVVHRTVVRDTGFFGCERCFGICESTARTPTTLPRTKLAKFMDRALAELAVKHGHLAEPFVRAFSPSTLVKLTDPAMPVASTQAPKSLDEIQRDVRAVKYESVAQLTEDLANAMRAASHLLVKRYPMLADAAATLPHLLEQKLWGADALSFQQPAEHSSLWTIAQPFDASSQKPIVVGVAPWDDGKRFPTEVFEPRKWISNVDRQVVISRGQPLKPRKEIPGMYAALVQALESARMLEPTTGDDYIVRPPGESAFLAPTRQEIDDLFEDHSTKLRSALTSASRLRKMVSRVLGLLQGEGDAEHIFTIGASHNGEVHIANRALRAELEQTRVNLAVERAKSAKLVEENQRLRGESDSAL